MEATHMPVVPDAHLILSQSILTATVTRPILLRPEGRDTSLDIVEVAAICPRLIRGASGHSEAASDALVGREFCGKIDFLEIHLRRVDAMQSPTHPASRDEFLSNGSDIACIRAPGVRTSDWSVRTVRPIPAVWWYRMASQVSEYPSIPFTQRRPLGLARPRVLAVGRAVRRMPVS